MNPTNNQTAGQGPKRSSYVPPSSGDQHTALAVPTRRRLLELLRSAPGPQGVATLAASVGVHVTTARFHLDVLQRAGLVERGSERVGRAGRPRQVYRATVQPGDGGGHRQLAEALAAVLAADTRGGSRRAQKAGQAWAEAKVPIIEQLSPAEITVRIMRQFREIGFAPRQAGDGRIRRVELTDCPFRELARSFPDVVCSVHLGLLRGMLQRLGMPNAQEARLQPFVEPQLCVAELPN